MLDSPLIIRCFNCKEPFLIKSLNCRIRCKDCSRDNTRVGLKAHQKIYKAVKSGIIVKPILCEKCGLQKYLEAHHFKGYAYTFKVQWVCQPCHNLLHAIEKQNWLKLEIPNFKLLKMETKLKSAGEDVWWACWEIGKRGERFFLGRVNGYRKVALKRAALKWPKLMNGKMEMDLLRDDVERDRYGRIIFA